LRQSFKLVDKHQAHAIIPPIYADRRTALNCIGGWFFKKRGVAYGIASTGGSVGGVVFPIMVNRLIEKLNYGWAMRISAFLILFLLIVSVLTVKTRAAPDPKTAPKGQLTNPLTEIGFVLLMVGIFLFTYGFFTPITYVTVLAIQNGMSPGLALYVIAILNAGR
jgi:MFS transporter, MCT family, aspergillic acid transporter